MAADLSSKLSLKLLIDTKSQKVLFAEAEKKTVDFLFHILTLPMATVIELLTKQQMVGCLANLYDSVENLSKRYIQSSQTKHTLLKPRTLTDDHADFSNPIFTLPSGDRLKKLNDAVSHTCRTRWMDGHCGGEAKVRSDYRDEYGHDYKYKRTDQKLYFSGEIGARSPKCNQVMSTEMSYVELPAPRAKKLQRVGEEEEEKGGFVKGFMNYMVMDDLVVKPMSTISSIALLNTMNVRNIGGLEEKVVDLGINEVRISFLFN